MIKKPTDETLLLDDEKNSAIPGHNYDGIVELSRRMPAWLTFIFFGTVTAALIYLLHMVSGSEPTLEAALAQQMSAIEAARIKSSNQLSPSDSNIDARSVFLKNCATCHGDHGEGTIGPNLTDKFWLHGQGQIEDIERLITKGVPEKGMPPWEQILNPIQVRSVTEFVFNLQGSNPANAKQPQGNEVK